MIKQAVISAGGFGKRLRPYTETMPKPMVPVLGKPLLEWHIEQFKKHGVTEFFFTLHYLPDVVMEYFGDGSRLGIQIHYFIEKEPLGSAGALKALEAQLDTTFYYIYGDTFSLMDYTTMANAFYTKENAIGMQRTKRTDSYEDADVAEIDTNGQFIAVHNKPHTEKYQNAHRMRGAFILTKKILTYIKEDTFFDMGKNLLPAVVMAGERFYGYECTEYSKGIDTIEKLREVEEYLTTHSL